jgi:major membrane immunogen (membrane-anchored lipoprotein)
MKKLLFILSSLLLIISCAKKEENFEAFSSEAFAYQIGETWEVNATVRARGITPVKDEQTDEYLYNLTLIIDLIKLDGTVEKAKFSYAHSHKSSEKLKDIGLEAQFELDSTYNEGTYKLNFHITDEHSKKSASIQKELLLER